MFNQFPFTSSFCYLSQVNQATSIGILINVEIYFKDVVQSVLRMRTMASPNCNTSS